MLIRLGNIRIVHGAFLQVVRHVFFQFCFLLGADEVRIFTLSAQRARAAFMKQRFNYAEFKIYNLIANLSAQLPYTENLTPVPTSCIKCVVCSSRG